jgi:hypothetical protein
MRLADLLKSLGKHGTSGASVDDLRNEFGDDNLNDIKRLVNAALDLQEVKKGGKGRGVKYYLINIEIPNHPTGVKKLSEENLLEGVIDISGCTTKEKIERILSSEHKLKEVHTFEYRQKVENQLYKKDLYDHINTGIIDVEIKIANVKGKNIIIGKNKRYLSNKVTISKETDGQWTVVKTFFECPDRPEILKFELYNEFEKCLKTLHLK